MTEDAPTPQTIFDTLVAYQKSAALAAAIDLDLFSAVAAGATRLPDLAKRCAASERGLRSLCDYLVVAGFLTRGGAGYGLVPESARFLDRASETYIGSIADFLASPHLRHAFDTATEAVRRGGTALEGGGVVSPGHAVWERFARAMAPMAKAQGATLVKLLEAQRLAPGRVLDVAAGHGLYGISLVRGCRDAEVVFQDWPGVLMVAEENARAAGLAGRFRSIPGDAFTVDLGGPYDTILLTNILHHFDAADCTRLLRRMHRALAPDGRAVTIESVVNPDRISPEQPAQFSFVMLVCTPAGNAYTKDELDGMAADAGFARSELHPLDDTMQQALISYR